MKMFQHTAARRRLEENLRRLGGAIVSTHSRPKAADIVCPFVHGLFRFQHTAARRRLLNTVMKSKPCTGFNTQPPEGGWGDDKRGWRIYLVSTHSRPKAAVEE